MKFKVHAKCPLQREVVRGCQEAEWWFYIPPQARMIFLETVCKIALREKRIGTLKYVGIDVVKKIFKITDEQIAIFEAEKANG